jgi:hypothetical protein
MSEKMYRIRNAAFKVWLVLGYSNIMAMLIFACQGVAK